MKLWQIQAQQTYITPDGWVTTHQIPTFYLHPDVQGITDKQHAAQIAMEIIGVPNNPDENTSINVVATEVYLFNKQ